MTTSHVERSGARVLQEGSFAHGNEMKSSGMGEPAAAAAPPPRKRSAVESRSGPAKAQTLVARSEFAAGEPRRPMKTERPAMPGPIRRAGWGRGGCRRRVRVLTRPASEMTTRAGTKCCECRRTPRAAEPDASSTICCTRARTRTSPPALERRRRK